ncbi:MAG: formate dehydrogenase subunit delta [Gammaproteobacteria bacterium]|nr:formate dehydrogenase subunit delta [Gammaproteobacteria bacterium]
MSHNQLNTLIRMANQIADNNHHYPFEQAVALVCNHLQKFWAKAMKMQIIAYYHNDGSELNPVVTAAIKQLDEHYQTKSTRNAQQSIT